MGRTKSGSSKKSNAKNVSGRKSDGSGKSVTAKTKGRGKVSGASSDGNVDQSDKLVWSAAKAALKANNVDLAKVLLEGTLKGSDGYEVLKKVHKLHNKFPVTNALAFKLSNIDMNDPTPIVCVCCACLPDFDARLKATLNKHWKSIYG